MDSVNLDLIELHLRSIFYLLLFFVIIRIIVFWGFRLVKAEKELMVLKEILKELKDKNKE